jgi:pimeloyl-ACP methyl ester carboxylesterase
LKPHYTLEDEYVLFFEPESEASRNAGKASRERIAARQGDKSPAIPEATYLRIVQESNDPIAVFADHSGSYATTLANTSIPLLAVSGDHDVVFPVENWYALNRKWKSLNIVTYPQSGHGPHHQCPELCADAIASFVRNVA